MKTELWPLLLDARGLEKGTEAKEEKDARGLEKGTEAKEEKTKGNILGIPICSWHW